MVSPQPAQSGLALIAFRWKVGLRSAIQSVFRAFGYQLQKFGAATGDAEDEQFRLASAAGGPIRVIVEVGASNGRDSLAYCARAAEAIVYAFEPLPGNFAQLNEKAQAEPRLVAVNAAVSDSEGEAEFFETALPDASSLSRPVETRSNFDQYMQLSGKTHKVRTVTLDAECARRGISRINILKMDCQGAEMAVFHGAAGLLAAKAIDVIYVEVQFTPLYENVSLYHDLAALLYSHGYALHNFYGMVSDENGRLSWGDAIFVAKP